LARILLGKGLARILLQQGLAYRLLTALEKKFKKNKNIPCSLSDLWYLKNMTTNNTNLTNNEIPASTALVRFTYAKPLKAGGVEVTQRIIRMGREVILPLLRGGSSWGKSNTQHRFVALNRKDKEAREYLQGAEEQEDGRLQIKRFDFSYIDNLEVVA